MHFVCSVWIVLFEIYIWRFCLCFSCSESGSSVLYYIIIPDLFLTPCAGKRGVNYVILYDIIMCHICVWPDTWQIVLQICTVQWGVCYIMLCYGTWYHMYYRFLAGRWLCSVMSWYMIFNVFLYVSPGSGQRGVHVQQPAGGDPDHAQQRGDTLHRLRWLRGRLHPPAVAVLHAQGGEWDQGVAVWIR